MTIPRCAGVRLSLGSGGDERALDVASKLRDPDEFMQYWVIKALFEEK